MNKQVVIQTNVPICPNCNGTLRFDKLNQRYICIACHDKFQIINYGQTEREFICEEIVNEPTSVKNQR